MDDHSHASQTLTDLVNITNLCERSFLLQIFVDSPDIADTISYTLIMESNVRKCLEIRRMSSDYTKDRYIEDCQNCIVQMETALEQHSRHACIKTVSSS